MKRTKDELLQSCIEQFEHIDSVNNNPTLNTTESLIREIEKAINYTRCCETFDCGDDRVLGVGRCKQQCDECKEIYG
jgi:hypothetical protein